MSIDENTAAKVAKLARIEVESQDLKGLAKEFNDCLLYTSPSPRDLMRSRMPSSA